jgi:hypothetical protein
MGRWLSRDPIEENSGENLYSFLDNDSIDLYDYLGLAKCCVNHVEIEYDANKQCCKGGSIKSLYRVCIRSGSSDHSWITITNLNSGSTMAIGNWHKSASPKKIGGPQINSEKPNRKSATRRCKTVCGPPSVDMSGGYAVLDNNCATFATRAWENMTGENISPSNGAYDSPGTVADNITESNGGSADNDPQSQDSSTSDASSTSNSSASSSGGSNSGSSLPDDSQGSSVDIIL